MIKLVYSRIARTLGTFRLLRRHQDIRRFEVKMMLETR